MRSAALLLAGLGGLTLVGPAAATDGNLYETGASATWSVGSQFSAAASGRTWTVSAPALGRAATGSKWEMNWGCPVPGSVISQVKWSALRSAAPSHAELDVLADGTRVWAIPDAFVPQSPAGGQPFDIGIASGSCNVHLRLVQAHAVAQHARTYFIDHPRVVLRDLTAPSVSIASIEGGWINGSRTHSEIRWSASDNFGSDGIGEQRVSIGSGLHYRGHPGAGTHTLNAGVAALGDGVHDVRVEADGDGTPKGSAVGRLSVDRTPPSVLALSGAHTAAPGLLSFAVEASDATSGVAETAVELNGAPDGSATRTWSRLRAVAGRSLVGASVAAAGVGDGLHAWRVVARDRAGNEVRRTAPAPVAVDTTAPSLETSPPPEGFVRRLRLTYSQEDNLGEALGLGRTEFAANTAADGSAGGAWTSLGAGADTTGTHLADLDLGGLADGAHLVRVRARNGGGLGERLFTDRVLTVRVDNSSPSVANASFRAIGGDRVRVGWIAEDALSGVARAVVQRRLGSGWQTLADRRAAGGAGRADVDVSGLADGPVHLRLVIHDAAGNLSETRAAAGTTLDGTPPSVTGLSLAGPPWTVVWTQSDAGGGLARCATSIQVSGPGTEGAWREIAERRLPGGRHLLRLPVRGLDPGAYRVRVIACDPSGNRGSAVIGGLNLSSADVATDAGVGVPVRFRGATLALGVRGARIERRRGRRVLVVRRPAGRPVDIRGRLRDRRGRPLARVLLHARGRGDRRIGATRTLRDGTFRLRARPLTSGAIRVGIPAGPALVPLVTTPGLRAVVAPRVLLDRTPVRVVPGRAVRFGGRIVPAPSRVGGRARKSVVLEWRDPLRGTWRPVINGRARRDGRFVFRWRFGVSGLTIPLRIRVPTERGWPLAPGRSRVVRVSVAR